jgi:hypothetical protein
MLDIYRTGATLFYKGNVLALASLLYSVFLTKGELLPGNFLRQAEHEIKAKEAKRLQESGGLDPAQAFPVET